MYVVAFAATITVGVAAFSGCLQDEPTSVETPIEDAGPIADAVTRGDCTMRWADVESGKFQEDEVCDMWITENDGDVVVGPYHANPEHDQYPYQDNVATSAPCVTSWEAVRDDLAAEDDMCTSWVTHDGLVVVGPYHMADELRRTGQIGQ